MMRIERLNIRLPHKMQPHAADIARRVASSIADARIQRSGRIETIAVPTIRLPSTATPNDLVLAVSQQILQQIEEYPS